MEERTMPQIGLWIVSVRGVGTKEVDVARYIESLKKASTRFPPMTASTDSHLIFQLFIAITAELKLVLVILKNLIT